MSTRRLKLYKDGSIGIGRTVLPQEAEIPAAQLGDCTVSKLFGEGRTLTATRGDGRVSRFEYRHGTWNRSETSSARGPTGQKKQSKKRPEGADQLAELRRLASLPLENFHVTYAEPEGDIALHGDGTVVLGSESFPLGVPIEGYRFGQSIAYREKEGDMLVIASPGGILWYYGWLPASYEWTNYSTYRPEFMVLDEGKPPLFSSLFERSSHPRQRLLGTSPSGIASNIYISVCQDVYISNVCYCAVDGLLDRYPYLRTPQIFERIVKEGHFNDKPVFPPYWMNHGRYVELPAGRRISYRDSRFHIEARPGYVRLICTERSTDSPQPEMMGVVVKLEESKVTLSEFNDGIDHPNGVNNPYSVSWLWYQLTPRQGTAGVV